MSTAPPFTPAFTLAVAGWPPLSRLVVQRVTQLVARPVALPVTLFVALSLAGCATPQERAARNQADVERMMAEYGPACARLGYTPNSDPWRHCVLDLSFRDDMQRYAPYGPAGDGWGPGGHWRGGWGRYW